MITKIEHNGLVWINLDSPSAEEVAQIAKEYPIHPLVAEELTSLTVRPKVDVYEDTLYLILHFPFLTSPLSGTADTDNSKTGRGCEIDLVIGRDFLITSHYCPFPVISRFFKNAKKNEKFRKDNFGKYPSFLAFNLLRDVYISCLHRLDKIFMKIDKIEDIIFDENEKKTIKKISVLKRDVLDFRRSIHPHESVLASFDQVVKGHQHKHLFGTDFTHYLNDLTGEFTKLKSLTDTATEILEDLHKTNESLMTRRTNEIMKVLTVMAFITFPLVLISSLFGMNTVSTPLLGLRGDFWYIIIAMVIATFAMFMFFKSKKWL